METKEKKRINLCESNRITYESLKEISGSIFEDVYRQADRTLVKIIKDCRRYKDEEGKDRQSLNVISFLGGRGRGKTSAMLSFLVYLNGLHLEDDWSEIHKKKDINFVILPYIDAAMLADAEYIIDVVLAEMWDQFEKHTKRNCNSHNADFERLERDIQQQFINVRQAYLQLKEREKGGTGFKERDVPVPSALHELAASVNLRDELQKLINDYLKIFQYDSSDQCYLIVAIDDVDMSGQKAHFILEQIRRFLRMQRIIIFMTADIDRLQLACEARYNQIYIDGNNRRRFINEYLEKVLPYNMRIYMPEVREKHGEIPVNTPAREELGLTSSNEKDMILEYISKRCGIYFDGQRRKRHFLQNQSMRSMVNYFEQMVRMKDESLAWLRIDLKERIIERIQNSDQKSFMMELLSKDYEDINNYLITYLERNNYDYHESDNKEKSMGQVLCACQSYEENDARNTEFVDAVIMLYSIVLKQSDEEMRKKVIGESLWGEQEYGLISSSGEDRPYCQSFDILGSLEMDVDNIGEAKLRDNDVQDSLREIIKDNETEITAWLYSLLYVTLDPADEIEFTLEETYSKINPEIEEDDDVDDEAVDGESVDDILAMEDLLNMQIGDDMFVEDISSEEIPAEDDPIEDSQMEDGSVEEASEENLVKTNWKIKLQPMANARKNYLTNAFRDQEEIERQCAGLLSGVLASVKGWIQKIKGVQENPEDQEEQIEEICDEILIRAGIKAEKQQDEDTEVRSSLQEAEEEENDDQSKTTGAEDDKRRNNMTIDVEILYSIGKVLSNQVRTYEFNEKEAYRILLSSYKTIRKELNIRDTYYKEHLGVETNFEGKFESSLPAKMMLSSGMLGKAERERFEERAGRLLMEFRGGTTILQKPGQPPFSRTTMG